MQKITCPQCGCQLSVEPVSKKEKKSWMMFDFTSPTMSSNSITTYWLSNDAFVESVVIPLARTAIASALASAFVGYGSGWDVSYVAPGAIITAIVAWAGAPIASLFFARPQGDESDNEEQSEPVRSIKVAGRGVSPARLALDDGRKIPESKVHEMVIGGQASLSLAYWKGRGWTRDEWEMARDVLADAGIATPRREREQGQMLVSTKRARELLATPTAPLKG